MLNRNKDQIIKCVELLESQMLDNKQSFSRLGVEEAFFEIKTVLELLDEDEVSKKLDSLGDTYFKYYELKEKLRKIPASKVETVSNGISKLLEEIRKQKEWLWKE